MTSAYHTTSRSSSAARAGNLLPSRQTLSAQVAQRLRQAIDEGHFPPEQRLPSEREMCTQLGVSRTVLREAQRELVRAGYIEVRHGSGSFVRTRASAQEQALADWLSNHDNHVVKLLEMRSLLEPGIAALAAQRADAAGIETLQRTVDLMRTSTDPDEVIGADQRFHGILAQLTGNSMIEQLIDHTLHAMGGEREVTLKTLQGVRVAADGHQKVIDEIRRRRPVAASKAMREHLADARAWALRNGAPAPRTLPA